MFWVAFWKWKSSESPSGKDNSVCCLTELMCISLGAWKAGNFLTKWVNDSLSKRILFYGINLFVTSFILKVYAGTYLQINMFLLPRRWTYVVSKVEFEPHLSLCICLMPRTITAWTVSLILHFRFCMLLTFTLDIIYFI